MNWLGEIIQNNVMPYDTVLDLGCGIMQATTDSMTKTQRHGGKVARRLRTGMKMPDVLRCKGLLGCDITDKYLDKAKKYFPVIKLDLNDSNSLDIFMNKSFDIVMALDVLEHIEYNKSIKIIGNMDRIARKKIIIYTPLKFAENEQENIDNAWDMGENPFQKHLSWISPDRFRSWGYKVSFPEPDKNTLAIKVVK